MNKCKMMGVVLFMLLGLTFLASCNKNKFCSCYSNTDVLISYERVKGSFSAASGTCDDKSTDTVYCVLTIPN